MLINIRHSWYLYKKNVIATHLTAYNDVGQTYLNIPCACFIEI